MSGFMSLSMWQIGRTDNTDIWDRMGEKMTFLRTGQTDGRLTQYTWRC
jgi:hypothetical protein